MNINRDEAIRCIGIAESALESGDKQRALKFIAIARRLDPEIPVEELLIACKGSPPRDRSYTDENVESVREIRARSDYYEILGLERSCTVEEIRKAYRKLSLKVHPDKNKAPGSDEAFKVVCKAFTCLNDADARREYDCNAASDYSELNWRSSNARRRGRAMRRERSGLYAEDLDADEVFRSFFFGSNGNVHRARHEYRARDVPREHHRETQAPAGEFSLCGMLQFVPFLVMLLILCLPFSEPDYALQKNYTFVIPKVVEKYGVEYYVNLSDFDGRFPLGSPARANVEYNVVKDYKSLLSRYCRLEMQRRQWMRNHPTPHCDKLRDLGLGGTRSEAAMSGKLLALVIAGNPGQSFANGVHMRLSLMF